MEEKGAEDRLSISAVLPAHNEQGNLEGVIGALVPALEKHSSGFEVIVVDDGSADGTFEVASRLAGDDPRIRPVRHEENQGYGAALRTGFDAAQKDWMFFMDADGQFEPADLEKLVRLAGTSRFVAGERTSRQDPFHRLLYGRLFSGAMRLLFGIKARDVNCAFKLFQKDIIKGWSFVSRGALINTELFLAARLKGIEPVQVPVTHLPRAAGRSSGGSLPVILRAAVEVWRLLARRYLGL
ncbi:MAG: glycosyltransferase family 2 protein [bacterium]